MANSDQRGQIDMCKWGTTTAMFIGDKIIGVDRCIYKIVHALNRAGCRTIASCCGHGNCPVNIVIEDGREILIAPDYKTAREIEKNFPDIWGNPPQINQKQRRNK